jgi:nitrite reductase (NADH) small subunit
VNASAADFETPAVPGDWLDVCGIEDIVPNSGVCALVGRIPVAVFRTHSFKPGLERLFALDNIDPVSGLSVISRGIIGDKDGEHYIASPIYKQKYSLVTGICIDDPSKSLGAHAIRLSSGRVEVCCI